MSSLATRSLRRAAASPEPAGRGSGAATVRASIPRVVVVSRPTDYEELLCRHGTRAQASFFLASRQVSIDEAEARHHTHQAALADIASEIPTKWRRSRVPRAELSRFVFEPGDVVVAVGQDGLVANVAKYLDGQQVVGVNPLAGVNAGVLVRHTVAASAERIARAAEGRAQLEERTMVEAQVDDGQRLIALNEIYLGHRSHQSARYAVTLEGRTERQSSSGLIVATGTGATGWSLSIARSTGATELLPAPTERALAFFVREAWPSPATGTALVRGRVGEAEGGARQLVVTSEMNEGGVVFGDGIEDDRLVLGWGMRVELRVAERTLRLVV
jgi:NAD kinase